MPPAAGGMALIAAVPPGDIPPISPWSSFIPIAAEPAVIAPFSGGMLISLLSSIIPMALFGEGLIFIAGLRFTFLPGPVSWTAASSLATCALSSVI